MPFDGTIMNPEGPNELQITLLHEGTRSRDMLGVVGFFPTQASTREALVSKELFVNEN